MTKIEQAYWRGFWKTAALNRQRPMPLAQPLPAPKPMAPPMSNPQMAAQHMGGGMNPQMAQIQQMLKMMPMQQQQQFAQGMNKKFDMGSVTMNPAAHL